MKYMYILKNVLIGIIILVIACATTVTLAIRNTAQNIVKDYKEANEIIATLSFNRQVLMSKFMGGTEAQRDNIEMFNNIEQIKFEDIKNYGESEFLKDYYYTYTTSLNSDTLSKATDTYEYEVEDKQTSTNTSSSYSYKGEISPELKALMQKYCTQVNTNTTTVITKSMEKFQSNRNLTGDFKLAGYSSYDAMTDFTSGTYTIAEGTMMSDFENYECVVNSELATLNELTVGDVITLKNPNTEDTYDFTVVGIYKDNSDSNDIANMYSSSVNTIITGSRVIEKYKLFF